MCPIMNTFELFCRACLEQTDDEYDRLFISDAFEQYEVFMTEKGYKFGLSSRRFYNQLKEYCGIEQPTRYLEPYVVGWRLL